MKIRTNLKFPSYPFKISYDEHILSIGSCFSTNIAQKLTTLKYNVIQNPCGVTFNPASIFSTIKSIIRPDTLLQDSFVLHNGLWSHTNCHGSYNNPDKNVVYSSIKASLQSAHQALPHISKVFLTIGTSHVFRENTSGDIVNNCHKRPASDFTPEILSVETIISLLNDSLDLLQNYNEKSIEFVLTVSPIRHIKNGIIEDKVNKSRCLLAVHDIVNGRSDAHYFPAYEVMMDDLRDYRYYADDLIHPSDVAINYIFGQFKEVLLDKNDEALRQRIHNIVTRQNHRPLFPDTKAHQTFIAKLEADITQLKEEHPKLRF